MTKRKDRATRLRFVHAADLHLDSPFKGLRAAGPEHVAEALYNATFKAWENIVKLCIEEEVDALLVAGDVYDGAGRSLRAQLKFIDGLKKLDDAGIRAFVCHGNHDPLDGWEAELEHPERNHRFGEKFKAEPVFQDDPGSAVVHGISHPEKGIEENLVKRLGKVDPGPFSIGLLHANLTSNPGDDPYAPCSLDDLKRAGVHYWALGHVHTHQVLHEKNPVVAYAGNPQGLHSNETGEHGVYLVSVDDGGKVDLDFRAMDEVRWERRDVDIGSFKTEQALLNALDAKMKELLDAADGRSVIVRVTLTGRGDLNKSLLCQPNAVDHLVEEINEERASQSPFAWCERIEDETAPPFDRQERLKGADFLAEVLRTADQAKEDPELLERLRTGISELYEHSDYHQYLSDSTPNEEKLASLVDRAEAKIVNLLAEDDS